LLVLSVTIIILHNYRPFEKCAQMFACPQALLKRFSNATSGGRIYRFRVMLHFLEEFYGHIHTG
jgi:hypothetical protein